jgi:adenylate cyclase
MLQPFVQQGRPDAGHIAMAESRENLTVLLVDVCDSTRLYESLGDEAAFREVRGCLDLFEKAVAANGGHVAKAVGDGLICAFAEPAKAVSAACDMQTAMRDRVSPGLVRIGIRVGLHYGPVLREGDDIYGDTVKIATRMTQFAASGQIITTGDTVEQLSVHLRAVTRHLEAFPASGREDGMSVHEVLWQESDEYTKLPGRFDAALAAAGIARMYLTHDGRETVVVSSLTLGREARNDIMLKDKMASRNHARIERRKDKYVLIDLSSNGTYVLMENGDQLKLRREEMIMYGSGEITFGHPAGEANEEAIRFRVE